MTTTNDQITANAFANSWNNLPAGSAYTRAQFEEWLEPITAQDVQGKTVLELGCGNGSLLVHMAAWAPEQLDGVDLGASVLSARRNMETAPMNRWAVHQGDLTQFRGAGHDLVYCIGVLHHLQAPRVGFSSVIANVKPGGRFHCWVYAREGNGVIRWVVDPLRKIASHLPWWVTKYMVATPMVAPYFFYAKLLRRFRDIECWKRLPLYQYSLWIAQREFAFFRHVAFDQLVTPQTVYIDKKTILAWLQQEPRVDPASVYIIFRNGNSWKFGGMAR